MTQILDAMLKAGVITQDQAQKARAVVHAKRARELKEKIDKEKKEREVRRSK